MITLPLASVMITVTLSVTIPEIAIKRMTLLRPKVSEELKKLIEECNSLDMELYNYRLKRLDTSNKAKGKFAFHGDRCDHIVA